MATRSIVNIKNNNNVYTYYRHCDGFLDNAGQDLAKLLKNAKNPKNFLNLINRFIYDNGNSVYEYKCTQNFIEDDWGAENYGQEYTYQIIFNKDENNKLVCDLTAYNYDMDILYNAKNHKSIIANNFLNYCKQVKTT
jgi:hypothetical protein